MAKKFAATLLKFAALAFMLQAVMASGAEIKLLSANGIKGSMVEIVPLFEKASGHKVTVIYEGGGAIQKKLLGGEAADVVIVPKLNVDNLAKAGKVVGTGTTPIARSVLGVAVRTGSSKPDISSPDAFKRTLLASKSLAYNAPEGSGSGTHITKVIEELGITKEMKAKTVATTSGGVGATVASGKAELGITQISSFVPVSGIEIVGPLPAKLQSTTVYMAASPAGIKNADAVKALITFLRGQEAAKVFKAKGMEPG